MRAALRLRLDFRESIANPELREVNVSVHELLLALLALGSRVLLLYETLVSSHVKRSSCSAALDTHVRLLFHRAMDPTTLLLLLVGVPPTPSSLRVRVWR